MSITILNFLQDLNLYISYIMISSLKIQHLICSSDALS